MRNEVEDLGGRLLLFVPGGEHLAAEDSFGASTFEVLPLDEIFSRLIDESEHELAQDHPSAYELVEEVRLATERDRDVTVIARADFLARVLEYSDRSHVGRALPALGLLPDSSLSEAGSVAARVAKNLSQMRLLADLADPVDRVRQLALRELEARAVGAALLELLLDGTSDRFEIARRIDEAGLDFSSWELSEDSAEVTELKILKLIGDFRSDVQDETIAPKAKPSIGIKYRCIPAPNSVSGLKELSLELLRAGDTLEDLAETGASAVKRRSALPRTATPQWRLRIDHEDLDPGVYRFRLRAVSEDNLVLAEALSDAFRKDPNDVVEREDDDRDVQSVVEARVAAALEHETNPGTADYSVERGAKSATVAARFQNTGGVWRLEVPSLLGLVERYTLEDPEALGRFALSFGSDTIEEATSAGEVDDAFLRARADLFSALMEQLGSRVAGSADEEIFFALADLAEVGDEIENYRSAWAQALARASSISDLQTLLSVDSVHVRDAPHASEVRVVGPTHPLRLSWLLEHQRALGAWLESAQRNPDEAVLLRRLSASIHPAYVPFVLPGQGTAALRFADSLNLHWGVWAPPGTADPGALIASLHSWLGVTTANASSIRVSDIVARIRRYLVSHPYADVLMLNIVQPGTAEVVLRALLDLQRDPDTEELRYIIRLFSSSLDRVQLGSALDQFMRDPEGVKGVRRNEADAFLSASEDPLTPKLTYSKHAVQDLIEKPDAYPAHITFFLDWFDAKIIAAPRRSVGRSLFADGLVVEPLETFSLGTSEANPQWEQQVVIPPSAEQGWIGAYSAAQAAMGQLLSGVKDLIVPAVQLELDLVRRSVLDAVHRTSDWVIIVDRVFTDEFLDTPVTSGERDRHLIDYVAPAPFDTSGRQVTVSCQSRDELMSLLRPVAGKLDVVVDDASLTSLLDGMHVLGAGLGLRLLNFRTQALEAFSLGLASRYLASRGVLRHALAIPLDLHSDLFGQADTLEYGLRRTDLAVIVTNPDRRSFDVHLIEVKARSDLGGVVPGGLRGDIGEQLDNSQDALREVLFGSSIRQRPGSFSAVLQVRRLYGILSHYLDRAVRFDLLEQELVSETRTFIASLDHSYSVAFQKHGLVFDFGSASSFDEIEPELALHLVGRTEIDQLLTGGADVFTTVPPLPDQEQLLTVVGAGQGEMVSAVSTDVPIPPGPAPATMREPERDEQDEVGPPPMAPPTPDDRAGPSRDDVDLVGTETSRQFGVIGKLRGPGTSVALDMDGTNVVSVFGVQGSGKSYTVGNIIEAAVLPDPTLTRLPYPLAAVVFHYSTELSFEPEFASMSQPNNRDDEVALLEEAYSSTPKAVGDVRILVPDYLVAQRKQEFTDASIEPLLLAPADLSINHWKLLMGLEGGEQMYARAMTSLFRSLRSERLSLVALKDAIEHADILSSHQRNLALTRLQFAGAFVGDQAAEATSHLAPGRVTIVDLRDAYVDTEQALALFMVMLELFAQSATDPESVRFNRLVVFDEAHKYMDSPKLTASVVELVREMRHRGASVVIASQNPPSVPVEVIELSSVVVAHKFTSPQWLDHLRRSNSAFGRESIQPSQLAGLAPGEAFVWSAGGDPSFRRPQRVRMRPRLTHHGGSTRRAAEGS